MAGLMNFNLQGVSKMANCVINGLSIPYGFDKPESCGNCPFDGFTYCKLSGRTADEEYYSMRECPICKDGMGVFLNLRIDATDLIEVLGQLVDY